MVPEIGDSSIRELLHGPYRIIYRVREKMNLVEIARYWHAARGNPTL
jgi:plasmid stabilization system protein ParE